jgi:rhodanese-related sulfurtransferase
MTIPHIISAPLFVLAVAAAAQGQSTADKAADVEVFAASSIDWKPGPQLLPSGAEIAMLEGDPMSEGRFVVWLRLPDGYQMPPCTHPKSERLNVLSGTLHIGTGEKLDAESTQALPAGTYARWPAGTPHFWRAEGEAIVQVQGEGPWIVNYVNVADDPRPPRARNVVEFTGDPLEVVRSNVVVGKGVLVDVRSREEWNQGHVAGAIALPVTSLHKSSLDPQKLAELLPAKSDEKILYTYCVVGMRAKQAAKILQEQGYVVRAVKPGYEQLLEAGFQPADDSPAADAPDDAQ